ncbi:MAG TPA: ABC transporter permease [Candidatus Dormibacteraeota bacterium]|nr:ABC transporter permease [Candidatus Dormibacteraeota bacterium]
MSARNIGIVYRKELTEALRDRRTLISTILVPLLAFPIMGIGFTTVAVIMIGKAKEEIPKVMILGGEDSPGIVEGLKKLDKIDIVPPTANWKDQVVNKDIRAAVEIPPGFQADIGHEKSDTVSIYDYEGEMKSEFAAEKINKYLNDYRDSVVKQRLTTRNIPETVLKPFEVKQQNVAPPEKVSGAAFGGIIGYMVILLCMTGAMYPAIDLTAGEKERGTMETILSSPISRMHLVLGKFLLILTAALGTAAISVLSMGISFTMLGHYAGKAVGGASGFILSLGPKPILSIFLMALPIAVLFSATLMTIALFAKTYKEAQSYLTPMTFVAVIPAIAAMLPGAELTPKLALIPILNTSLVCKEIISGTYHWNLIAIIFGSTCLYAAAALFLAIKMFQRESVLFRS